MQNAGNIDRLATEEGYFMRWTFKFRRMRSSAETSLSISPRHGLVLRLFSVIAVASFSLMVVPVDTVAAESSLQRVDFQLRWHHQFQFAGYYAALEKGYYREEGLDVHIHEAAPGRTPVEEVLAGRAQYAESNSEVLYARLMGKPVVALAAIFQHSPSVLLARKDANIYSPHDLIGKKIMLLNARTDADFHAMLLHEGIQRDAIDIIPSSLDIDDLVNGKVAAFNSYLTNEPYYLQQHGIEFTVINPSTYGIDFYSDILFTTEDEIKHHPERVEAFRRATLKGWRYAMDHPEEIIDLLLNQYHVPKSRDHLEFEAKSMRPLILPDIVEIGHMNPGRWQHMAEAFTDVGMGDKNFSLEGFIYDPSPSRELNDLKKQIKLISWVSIGALTLAATLLLGWMRLKSEIRRREVAEAEVRKLAYNDALTGIPNRNSFIPYATKQLLAAERTGQKLALCFIDLNHFKEINDQHGHEVGDAVLVFAAKAICSVIRESDMAARMGGDEFVILLNGIQSLEDTRRIIEEIQHAMSHPFIRGDVSLNIKASIGVALYPDDGTTLDTIIAQADTDMFRHKFSMKAARDQ
jgi:diguanylate cyclase (GGDEF)-like protein